MVTEDARSSVSRTRVTAVLIFVFGGFLAHSGGLIGRAIALSPGATPTPVGLGGGAVIGPPVTYFGVASGNGCACCNDPGCLCNSFPMPTPALDGQGRQIFLRPVNSGFLIVVEGGTGVAGPLPQTCTTAERPALQIESSRTLGAGPTPPAACAAPPPGPTPTPNFTTAIPGIDPPDYGSITAVTIALQEFGQRFGTFGGGSSACTYDCSGNPNFLNTVTSVSQYCYLLGLSAAFPPGDTVLTARFRDASQNLGQQSQIVVRVPTGAGFDVSGHLRYYSNMQPVSGATVQAQGASSTSVQSDATGQFTLPGLGAGNWQITPRKLGTSASAITALDAVQVLQSTVHLRTFTAPQALAADVSGNGAVTALDAVLILQFSVGLISHFPVGQACNSDWAFVPVAQNQTLIQPIMTSGTCQPGGIAYQPLASQLDNQDFTGVMFGDPSGNWVPAGGGGGGSLPPTSASKSVVELGRPRWKGSRVSVPLHVRGNTDYQGLDVLLRYDEFHVAMQSIHRLRAARQALFAVNDRTPGTVRLSLASSQPLHAGAVLNLRFTASRAGDRTVPVQIVQSTVE